MSRRRGELAFELDDVDEEDLDDEDRESERDLGDDEDEDDTERDDDEDDDVPQPRVVTSRAKPAKVKVTRKPAAKPAPAPVEHTPISAIVEAVASAHLVTPRELWTKAKAGTLQSVRNARNVAMAAVAAAGVAKGNGHLFGVSDSALFKAKQFVLGNRLAIQEQLERYAKGISVPAIAGEGPAVGPKPKTVAVPKPPRAEALLPLPAPKASLADILPAPAPALGREALILALGVACAELERDAVRVVLKVAERLAMGRKAYGDLTIATDGRDFMQEAASEAFDGMAYLAMAQLRAEGSK